MFITLKKRAVFFLLSLVFSLTGLLIFFCRTTKVDSPNTQMSIVIDAGHGGDDGGAVGKSGISESYLNLQYAKELESLCKNAGFKVVMTRTDMNGLYSITASNKKRSEMEKRASIINNCNANLVVSIHMNSFPLTSSKGAQVFFKNGNQSGEALAESIQNRFIEELPSARQNSAVGDYFVLNCTDKPAVLIECGFLSNPEEEASLCNDNYRKKFCEAVIRGIFNFFEA